MFAYSVFYFYTKLEITKFVSALLYFGYMSIAALVFFVSTGTIGFYACYWFVWKVLPLPPASPPAPPQPPALIAAAAATIALSPAPSPQHAPATPSPLHRPQIFSAIKVD